MKEEKIKEIEQLFLAFYPLYYQNFSAIFREEDGSGFRCNKNQRRALVLIKRHHGITSSELGQCLDMRKGSLTTLLDSLEERGLVERKTDTEDRRKSLLFLTARGEEFYQNMMARHEAVFLEMFSRLPQEDIDQCLAGIKYVVDAISKL